MISDITRSPIYGKLWDLYTHGVTQSMIATWLSCPEKMRLMYVEGLTPESKYSHPLEFGHLIHTNLEIVYGQYIDQWGHSHSDVVNAWRYELDTAEEHVRREAFVNGATAPELDRIYELYGVAGAILEEYYQQWAADFTDIKWVHLEQEFNLPYEVRSLSWDSVVDGKDVPLRGKIDGVITRTSKLTGKEEYWVVDHKTKSRIDDDGIVDRLTFDLQMGVYMWAVEQIYGVRPAGIVYNLIRRPQLRRSVKESAQEFANRCHEDIQKRPEWYFMRYEVRVHDDEIQEWRNEFQQIMQSFVKWYEGQFNYRNSTSCYTGWSACPYLRVCGAKDTSALVRREVLFPELDHVAIAASVAAEKALK